MEGSPRSLGFSHEISRNVFGLRILPLIMYSINILASPSDIDRSRPPFCCPPPRLLLDTASPALSRHTSYSALSSVEQWLNDLPVASVGLF
ncbi:hypothetical protein BDZ89DRAFT_1065359 [Hymenopellis radicata]|nr:hypothetical protein BDZ89DRAFT_1065359 [Hymenopellis radicata]